MEIKHESAWMKTMIKKYGSREAVSVAMAEIGRRGGKASGTGGFAADVECNCSVFHYDHFVKNCAGKKGGSMSPRRDIKNV